MNSIIPHQNDFDLFAKLIAMDQSIRRVEVDGIVYFAMVDILEKMSDSNRSTNVRQFWNNFKRSKSMQEMSLNLRQLKIPSQKDGKSYQTDCGDYATVLYIATSIPDKMGRQLRQYITERMAQVSEPTMKYLLRQQLEGKALAAEEIRYLYQMGHLALPEPDNPFSDLGYRP